ncbi:MAG: ROK family protein [Myxococcota bacterium]
MRTLCVDVGGAGIKALVVGAGGEARTERARVPTPRPATPEAVLQAILGLAAGQGHYDRVSVGFPGVVEDGVIGTAVNLDGEEWVGYPLADVLHRELGRPVRVANDAGVQGLGVVQGHGTEVVVTLGTGMGFGLYIDGRYVPNIELGHHPFRKGQSYEERVCEAERAKIGTKRWRKRVHQVVEQLRHTFNFRELYIGGGNARLLAEEDFGERVRVVDNVAGLIGGLRLWSDADVSTLDDLDRVPAGAGSPGRPARR